MGICECDVETSASIKGEKYLAQLNDLASLS
jgi:hypothetical protein